MSGAKITLVGMGMGAPETLTLEADAALASAEVVIGAERLVRPLAERYPAAIHAIALPDKIAGEIGRHPEWRNVCVALSGDAGFYSGARSLLSLLSGHETEVVCGLSSPQYLAARLRRPWQGFRLVSAHGVDCDVLAEALNHPEVFFLAGGSIRAEDIVAVLCECGLGEARVTVGENLSSPGERIVAGAARELADAAFSPLSVVLVENAQTFRRPPGCGGIEDEAFRRGDAPMTKREIRSLALSLLNPGENSILYDVGAGTGSVAVEMALLARRGRVFAVESDAGAADLIGINRERFGTYNLRVVRGRAPDALNDLPPPDAVFIGGSKGAMEEIVERVLAKNGRARIVISAVTLETLSASVAALEKRGVADVEVRQASIARTVRRGGYRMLDALNPVFLISGGGR